MCFFSREPSLFQLFFPCSFFLLEGRRASPGFFLDASRLHRGRRRLFLLEPRGFSFRRLASSFFCELGLFVLLTFGFLQFSAFFNLLEAFNAFSFEPS